MDNSSNNLSISNNNDIIAAEEDIGNFTELDNYINNEINSGHYEINLNKSYKYVDGDVNEIEINHKNHGITIYGNNHFIDANNSNSRIFLTFTYDTAVVLKDITFLNAHSQNGAIYTRNPDVVIDNCTFENNSGKYGGAMYIAGNNSQIINCTFRNNSATTSGGAIHIGSVNVTISGSKFDNNIAANYGGAININNKNATIVNCNFNNNNVTNKDRTNGGGAICLQKSINSTISKSTFTNLNGGGSGGAIYVTSGSDNVTIDSCSFNNTESYVEGGAICSSYFNKLTITNCNFTECEVTNVAKSNPGSYGGAIRGASHSNNLIIMGCIFDSNTAHLNAGGAIEYYGVNITVTNCDFKNNTAHSDGGAIYCHSTGFVNITGCNFTGNKIEEAYLKGTPMGPFSGGAILLRKNPTNYDSSDVSYVPLETFIINCRFVDNVAPGFGGGVCIRTDAYNPQHLYDYKHNATFDDCYFDGNNATLGSAIYIYKTCYVNISDTVFGENRANSSSIQPMVEKNGVNHTDNNVKFYYLSDVPTHVNFTAWDNIANAIWNSGYSAKASPIDIKTPGKIDDISGDVNQVQLKNVTFDIYRNGAVEQMVTPNSYVTPKEGYANSNNGDDVWQDTLEDNQLIYLTLVNDDNNTIVYQNEQFTTDVPGNISRVFKNLKPGNYTLKASHPKDVYYTQISNTISFEVVEILNISKTTTDIDVFVGDIVTYTITIQNTKDVDLKNVTVKDDAPDSFILLDNYTSSWNKKGDDTFVYNGILGAKSSITLTVSYRTTKTGKYNNTVFVSTNETNPLNTTSENTTVRAHSTVNGTNVTVTYGEPIVVPYTSENSTAVVYRVIDKSGKVVANGTVDSIGSLTGLDLAVGNYTVNWTTKVDGNHTVAYNQSSITVNPAPSVVEGENVTVTYGEPIVVPYTSDNSTAVVYRVIDKSGKVVANGTVDSIGSLTGLDLAVGNYTVNWTTKVDGNHTVAYNQSSITVNPAPSVVEGENVTVTYGEPIVVPYTSENATSIIYEIIDEDGKVVANGTVGSDGSLTGLDLAVGNYTVNWTTKVDGNHTVAYNQSSITVNPAPSVVEGENVTVTYGEPIVVPYTSENATSIIYEIIDEDGKVVANGTVGSDGSLTGLDLAVGNYTVNWTTKVDGNHTVAYNQSSITVNPAPSVVEGENVTVTYGEPIVVPYTSENATSIIYEIIDEDGNVVANGTVGSDGSLTGLDLPVGNYTVNWTTKVDGNHTVAYNQSSITVNPAPSVVEGENVTVTYGEPIVVPVTSENATSIIYEIIDEGGNVIVNGTINPGDNITGLDLPVGNYTVNWTTVVDGNHTSATNSSMITVNPAPSVVEGENVTVTYGEPIVVPVTSENATSIIYEIIDEDGKVVANGTVGSDGSLTGLDLPVGNYTVNWTTVVDGNHTSATNSSMITVNPAPSTVQGENVTVTYGEPIVVPVTSENATSIIYEIIDEDGKVVANGTVGSDGSLTGLDLPVGNYTVNWTTVVDGNHTSATNSSMITVNPAPSTVQGENVTVTYGEPIVVPYTSENATSIIYEIIDEDGKVVANGTVGSDGSLTGLDLPVGNYTVNWTTVVDGNHTSATNSSMITVNPAPSTVQGENVTVTYGEPIVVPVTSENATSIIYEIIDEDGKVVANGTVGSDGSLTGLDLPVGNYAVNWTTVVDGNHTSATNSSMITVNPAPSTVQGENVTVTYGEPIVVPVTSENATSIIYEIIDGDGKVVANGTVGSDGSLTGLDLPVGNYAVNWTTVVDGNHTSATNSSMITVNPAPSTVQGENVTVTYGEPIVVPVTSENATSIIYEIVDEEGNVIVNGTIGPGENITGIDLPVGNYTVNLTTVVDGNHTVNTNQSSITVNPAPSTVQGENVTAYVGYPIEVPIISENATSIIYEIIDEDGNVVANGTIGPGENITCIDLPVGNYTVNLTTVVDGNHTSATNTSTITVQAIPTQVTIGNITSYPGENVTIPITVTILDGQPFTGNVAVIMPDNTTQIVSVVNGTGTVTWYVPDDYTPDKYPDSIRFPGSDVYLPSNGTGIIEVVKIPTKITVGNVTTYPGRDVTIPINVAADDGKPFNGKVTVTLPDGTTKVVEIVNGKGSVDWSVPSDYTPDKYPDTVRFAGDNKYLPSEGKGTITVVKIPVDIIVGNVTAKPGEHVTIPIKVIPRDGSVFNGKVTVELPDGTKKVIDIVNGEGTVDWIVPDDYRGVFPIKVSFDGSVVYYPAEGTGFITVIPDEHPVENKTATPIKDLPKDSLKHYETGNPIMALLAVLALLGVGIRRRK